MLNCYIHPLNSSTPPSTPHFHTLPSYKHQWLLSLRLMHTFWSLDAISHPLKYTNKTNQYLYQKGFSTAIKCLLTTAVSITEKILDLLGLRFENTHLRMIIDYLQINPLGPCCVSFIQNDPGMWDSSLKHSTAMWLSLLNFLYAPQLSSPLLSCDDAHW